MEGPPPRGNGPTNQKQSQANDRKTPPRKETFVVESSTVAARQHDWARWLQ